MEVQQLQSIVEKLNNIMFLVRGGRYNSKLTCPELLSPLALLLAFWHGLCGQPRFSTRVFTATIYCTLSLHPNQETVEIHDATIVKAIYEVAESNGATVR